MKKLFLVVVLCVGLICGCQANNNSGGQYSDEVSKTQEIAVIPAGASDIIETITDKKDIEEFVLSLDMNEWEIGELPKSAEEVGTFGLSQEETIKLGQTETDSELYDVCKIVVYDEAYVDFEIGGLNMTFAVSEDTASYLNGFFK